MDCGCKCKDGFIDHINEDTTNSLDSVKYVICQSCIYLGTFQSVAYSTQDVLYLFYK